MLLSEFWGDNVDRFTRFGNCCLRELGRSRAVRPSCLCVKSLRTTSRSRHLMTISGKSYRLCRLNRAPLLNCLFLRRNLDSTGRILPQGRGLCEVLQVNSENKYEKSNRWCVDEWEAPTTSLTRAAEAKWYQSTPLLVVFKSLRFRDDFFAVILQF